MDRQARREHLEALLDELLAQRKVDVDQLLMELLHVVFELDDEVRQLSTQISKLERRG
jgi:hypothetical protein